MHESEAFIVAQRRMPQVRRGPTNVKKVDSKTVEEDYEITIHPLTPPGDYQVGRNEYQVCFRVQRLMGNQQLVQLVEGDLEQLLVAVELKSPLAIPRIKQRLADIDKLEPQARVERELETGRCWHALSAIGTEEAARVLLRQEPYMGQCMRLSPRGNISSIGVAALGPALEMLRDWKKCKAVHLNSALQVLGPMTLEAETKLLKEIASEQHQIAAKLNSEILRVKSLDSKEEVVGGGYSKSEFRVSQLHELRYEHLHLLRNVLSRLDASERDFVLGCIRPYLDEPASLALLVPQAFIRSDARWVAAQLRKEIQQRPNKQEIQAAYTLGFENGGTRLLADSIWLD